LDVNDNKIDELRWDVIFQMIINMVYFMKKKKFQKLIKKSDLQYPIIIKYFLNQILTDY